MYLNLKVIHIFGVVLFFGSILAHMVASIFASTNGDAQILYIVRQVMAAETKFLLVPGIFLFFASGIAMIIVGKLKFKTTRWLMLHAIIGSLVILNAIFILLPAGQDLLAASQQIHDGTITIDSIQKIKTTESIFGAINVLSCLTLLVLGVIKPKLERR